MEWREKAIVLGARRHGETNVIAQLLTRDHGRHAGVVRGGRSRRMRPVLQQGNLVEASWRARLEDHLGNFTIEAVELNAAMWMASPLKLAGLSSLTAMCALLPEREPHGRIFDATLLVLEQLENDDVWPALLVRWEAGLLEELGFGLDLGKCALTGCSDDLAYVSPKTGRAVTRQAGAEWRDKLLALPGFLTRGNMPASVRDISDGFVLTGHFLNRHIYEPRGLVMPDARGWIIDYLKNRSLP